MEILKILLPFSLRLSQVKRRKIHSFDREYCINIKKKITLTSFRSLGKSIPFFMSNVPAENSQRVNLKHVFQSELVPSKEEENPQF